MLKKTAFFLIFIAAMHVASAQTQHYSISEITRDLMIVDHRSNELAFVWWLPYEYWEILFDQQLLESKQTTEELLAILKQHNIFAVMKGEIGQNGNVVYKSGDEITQNIIFTDAYGSRYFPVKPENTEYRLQMLFTNFKPVFAQMMGSYGQNINLVVFDVSQNPESRPNPTDTGRYYMKFFNKDYSFRLPVGSFLPPKYCPVDGEKYKGHWDYCPFHGNKLTDSIEP